MIWYTHISYTQWNLCTFLVWCWRLAWLVWASLGHLEKFNMISQHRLMPSWYALIIPLLTWEKKLKNSRSMNKWVGSDLCLSSSLSTRIFIAIWDIQLSLAYGKFGQLSLWLWLQRTKILKRARWDVWRCDPCEGQLTRARGYWLDDWCVVWATK